MDKLKQYLRENREMLDVECPPEDLWPAVQAQAAVRAPVSVPVKALGSLCVVVVVASGVWLVMNKKNPAPVAIPKTPQKNIMPADTVSPPSADTAIFRVKPGLPAPVTPPEQKSARNRSTDTPAVKKFKKLPDSTQHKPVIHKKKKVLKFNRKITTHE